jgi:hypothetical protein
MDSISNGLDTATTFDIIRSIAYINRTSGLTNVIALLQVKLIYLFLKLFEVDFLFFHSLLQMFINYLMRSSSYATVISSTKDQEIAFSHISSP